MNEIINKFLLAADTFMPEIHLKQPGLTYSACGPFTKNKERIKAFKVTGDSRYIYQNELDKACFQHDIALGDFKDLNIRTAADKVLSDKSFDIAKNPKFDGYQRGLSSVAYKFFEKEIYGSAIKHENISNKQLAEELQKPIIRKFNKRNAHSAFIDSIWGVDLADMQLKSKFNKEFRFVSCVIDIYSKHACVIPLKEKKQITITDAFQKILNESNHKPNIIRVE